MRSRTIFQMNNWKRKANTRAKALNACKKRTKELTDSRNKVKLKNAELRTQNKALTSEISELHRELKKN